MYHLRDGQLEWHDSQDENAHIEVVVRDAADGRFIPGLTVYATLLDRAGTEIGTHQQPFLWHPWLYHYERNWRVPGDGTYTLRGGWLTNLTYLDTYPVPARYGC